LSSNLHSKLPLVPVPPVDIPEHTRALLAAIVESSDDAIISKNLNGIITSWNEGAARIFGYTPEEMVGQSILRLIPEELRYQEDEILSKLRAGERIDHFETVRVRKNGERIEISVTISPVKDSTGRIVGASKIARDISIRKQMERLLIQSEKLAATGRMAATIAHEINNPLESLMNLVFLARTSCASDEAAHAYLLIAEKELDRVSHLARQTLGYYRGSGVPVEVHPKEIMEDVLTIYHAKLLGSCISVESQFDDLRPITLDKGELVQIFSNVIANSIDAMPQGGLLHVEITSIVRGGQEGVLAVIRDQGMGIPQEHMAKVFEPFFTTKGDLGTGIGLWVAKRLVEKRGGQLSITSSTEPGNSGTSLSIYLPFAAPHDDDTEKELSPDTLAGLKALRL
jgi:PAS domain S-box-containing protein